MAAGHWLQFQGFTVVHTPGISRAWRYEFPDGRFLLVTDVGGFDLPEQGGPYSAICLSRQDELVEFAPLLMKSKDLYRFIRRQQRRGMDHSHHSIKNSHGMQPEDQT